MYPNLVRPRRDSVRDDAVDACRGDEQCEYAEDDGHRRCEPRRLRFGDDPFFYRCRAGRCIGPLRQIAGQTVERLARRRSDHERRAASDLRPGSEDKESGHPERRRPATGASARRRRRFLSGFRFPSRDDRRASSGAARSSRNATAWPIAARSSPQNVLARAALTTTCDRSSPGPNERPATFGTPRVRKYPGSTLLKCTGTVLDMCAARAWLKPAPTNGGTLTSPTSTPGVEWSESASRRTRSERSAAVELPAGTSTVIAYRLVSGKPVLTLRACSTPRASSPEITSRTSDTATCPATSECRRRAPGIRSPRPLASCLSAASGSTRVAYTAGAAPKSTVAASAARLANESTVRSGTKRSEYPLNGSR